MAKKKAEECICFGMGIGMKEAGGRGNGRERAGMSGPEEGSMLVDGGRVK